MIDCAEFKELAVDAERVLGITQEEIISLLIQGCIRAYSLVLKDVEGADVSAQFNPANWTLDVIVRKKIVKSVTNVMVEIGAPEAKLISPGKSLGDKVDVVVTENTLRYAFSIAGPEVSRVKVILQKWRRKVPQLENTARLPHPLPMRDIVRLELLRVTELLRLGGREEAPLGFNEPIELVEVWRFGLLRI